MSAVGSLPAGFRFHPTDEELISYYLRNRVASVPCPVPIIAEVDIYKFNPWDLPSQAKYGEKEWYFFSPRDRKYPNGARPNRAAGSGYWKATGTDKPILSSKTNKSIGVKKALVFYQGKPPKGVKSEWIMHEFRLTDSNKSRNNISTRQKDTMRLDDWVLCRIYKKTSQNLDSAQEAEEEKEKSVTEDSNPQILPNSNTFSQVNIYPSASIALPKSSSLANLLESFESIDHPSLSRLFDNSDITGWELGFSNNTKLNQQFISNDNLGTEGERIFGEVYQTESSVSATQNAPKRPRMEKTSMDGSMDFSQFFMNQNLLLNYQF
ncbi:hypothetical protein LUZ63_017992 [Rhynchospora breviuscula]|uniref:NAC domain-containing protein n=1 Tax=Rhynchospora breviuscula TaxID=2022672 RepID=A0A9Q0C3J9_9POAL|nr:hypothetical protein LUZ63_017992 [Rhynchospora breviuscula]